MGIASSAGKSLVPDVRRHSASFRKSTESPGHDELLEFLRFAKRDAVVTTTVNGITVISDREQHNPEVTCRVAHDISKGFGAMVMAVREFDEDVLFPATKGEHRWLRARRMLQGQTRAGLSWSWCLQNQTEGSDLPMEFILPTFSVLAAVIYSGFLKILAEHEKRQRYYIVMLVLDGLALVASGLLLGTVGLRIRWVAGVFGVVVLFRFLSALGSYAELRKLRIREHRFRGESPATDTPSRRLSILRSRNRAANTGLIAGFALGFLLVTLPGVLVAFELNRPSVVYAAAFTGIPAGVLGAMIGGLVMLLLYRLQGFLRRRGGRSPNPRGVPGQHRVG